MIRGSEKWGEWNLGSKTSRLSNAIILGKKKPQLVRLGRDGYSGMTTSSTNESWCVSSVMPTRDSRMWKT